MSNLLTSEDLLKQALRDSGEVDNGASRLHAKALEFLNESYLSVLMGHSEYALGIGDIYPWALEADPLCITLKQPITEGTISLTYGSASGTFSSAPSESMARRYLKVSSDSEIYQIATHVAGQTAFTLACNYIRTTGSYSFEARKIEYDLGSEVLRLAGPIESFKTNQDGKPYQVNGMDWGVFNLKNPLPYIENGFPSEFCVYIENDDEYVVMFNGYGRQEELLKVPYIKKPDPLLDSQGSIPILPAPYRKVLYLMTSAKILIQEKKQFDAGKVKINMANRIFESMSKGHTKQQAKTGQNYGRLIPRRSETQNGYLKKMLTGR